MAEALLKTSAEILDVIGAEAVDLENWLKRLDLRTKYLPGGRGKPRLFTRENVIELAVIAALVGVGARPQIAAAYADSVLRSRRAGDQREWLIFPAGGDISKGFGMNKPDADALADKFGAVALSMVRVGEILRRVDRLFEDD